MCFDFERYVVSIPIFSLPVIEIVILASPVVKQIGKSVDGEKLRPSDRKRPAEIITVEGSERKHLTELNTQHGVQIKLISIRGSVQKCIPNFNPLNPIAAFMQDWYILENYQMTNTCM